MRKIAFLFALLISSTLNGQTVIDTLAIQDFEIAPQSPVWNFTGPVIYNSGFSSPTAAPPNSPIGIGGSRAWETTTNSGGLILDFDNITIPAFYDSVKVSFRLAAMCLTASTGGPDDLDYMLVAYSTDGGTTYANRIRIRGAINNNSFWPYSATGEARVYYTPATESLFQPTLTGLATTLGYSFGEITFPGSIGQVKLRMTGRSSSSSDTWLVDNVVITGIKSCTNSAGSFSATACGSYLSPSGNHLWTSSGTYLDTLPNAAGCDSVITANITITPHSGGSLTGTYCDSLRSPSGNYLWTMPGVYYDTIPNAAGCDSIILANIVVFQSSSSVITDSSCTSYTAPSGATYSSSGTYIDVIPNSNGCDSTITINLTINTLTASATNTGNVLTASPAGAAYQWIDCNNNGAPIPNAIQQAFQPLVSGSYAVVVSQNGCTDTTACDSVTIVGLESPSAFQASILPNPASTQFILEVNDLEQANHYEIYSVTGNLVLAGFITSSRQQVDISRLAPGTYFVEIGKLKRLKLLKF